MGNVVCSEKRSNDISYFEHFIKVCGKHGLDSQIDERRIRLIGEGYERK